MFDDVFMELFKTVFDRLHGQVISGLALTAVVRKELLSVRDRLLELEYPNFTSKSKLRLCLDEAQILSDQGLGLFESSYSDNHRPMLSSLLYGFRDPGERSELTVIYCGTGLSIRTLHWALSSSDGTKEGDSQAFPHLDYPGWTSPSSIQAYIDRVKSQVLDEESKKKIDTLLPLEAIDVMFERLAGRFRPIIMVIEEVLRIGEPHKWEGVIDDIERMLTSYEERARPGNIIHELTRVAAKMKKHFDEFKSYSSVDEILSLYLFRWFILGEKDFILEDQAQLVEAALGRIWMLGTRALVVINEPFILKAAINYFKEIDPLFFNTAQQSMLRSTNACVHGTMWETLMPALFIETFKTRPLDTWQLLPNNFISMELHGNVNIVGYSEQRPQLAITHKDITLHDFIETHIHNATNPQQKMSLPPFYFPSAHISGPDVVFLIQIQDQIYPVFVQTKLRHSIPTKDAVEAVTTTSSRAIQEKIDKEQKLDPKKIQNLCPAGVYISISSRGAPHLDRVVIKIDNSNFPNIFPKKHVEFLDKLKGFKRKADRPLNITSKKQRKQNVVVASMKRWQSDPIPNENHDEIK
ncbi:hypothetical protein BGZ76_002697 [Entomortierella beljakovae]|nr:hypothetical protein BGZ76_002697 [Entomortierella beljakovae]